MTQLTQSQARTLICDRWITEWDALHPQDTADAEYIPYQIENEHFQEPQDITQRWVRLSVRHLQGVQHTLGTPGTRTFRRPAMIWIQMFGPVNGGMAQFDVMCDQVKAIFEGVSFSGVDPNGTANVLEIGDDGRWYEVVVTIPVTYYELK